MLTTIISLTVAEVRLVGISSNSSGRLEVFHNDQWGTVCSDGFDNRDAAVVCRQLGYVTGVAIHSSIYGPGSGPIWLDDVRCGGTERQLAECNNRGWDNIRTCLHDRDAAVNCMKKGNSILKKRLCDGE